MPPADPGEVWDVVTQQIYGPDRDFSLPKSKLMRGFYLNYAAAGKGVGSNDDILATSTPADLSVINTLARSFAVSDMWFASAPTQTNPNRAFSLAGTCMGRQNNLSFDGVPFTGLRTIFGILDDTGNSWKLYADHEWIHGLYFTQYMFPEGMSGGRFGNLDDFKNDDVVPKVGDSNVPVAAVPQMVSRITGVARGTPEHDAPVAGVPNAKTQQEVGEAFQDLRRRYGSLPCDGVRAR